jgi:hypothetical protein
MTGHVIWVLLIRVLLVFAVGGVFALVWLLPHLGFHWLRGPADKVLRHPLLGGLRRHAPGLVDFAKRHFIDQRRSWLRAILGVLVVLFGLAWFRSLLRGVITDGAVVKADQTLHNTVGRLFHSPAMHRFYSLMSDLGSTAFLAVLVVSLAGILWAA